MQQINNVFDRTLSVADAATLGFFTSSQCLGFTYIKSARYTDRAKMGSDGEKG